VTDAARQRVDLWLHRARFAKTRAAAARLIAEGGVRVVRDGAARRLEKASAELAVGDALVFALRGRLSRCAWNTSQCAAAQPPKRASSIANLTQTRSLDAPRRALHLSRCGIRNRANDLHRH
jgi:ribosomal 50S subunit-recycling heat shock protein